MPLVERNLLGALPSTLHCIAWWPREIADYLLPASKPECLTRFVRMSLTPQLMSKPTPPGDTTASGLPISNAATFPIAKPYPECISGSAMDFCKAGSSHGSPVCMLCQLEDTRKSVMQNSLE